MTVSKHFRWLGIVSLAVVVAAGWASLRGASASAKFSQSMSVTISVGGIKHTSDEAGAYAAAVATVNDMCANGYRVGFAGYPHSISRSGSTIRYSVTTLARSCWSNSTKNFAVTGYEGLCPVAGWYHNGTWPTHDCIKYQSASTLGDAGGGRGRVAYCDPCGHCGKTYHVNDCSAQGNWWSYVSGHGRTAPPSGSAESRSYSGFTYSGTIDFSASSGSVEFTNRPLQDYWMYPGTGTVGPVTTVWIQARYVWNNTPDVVTTGSGTQVRTEKGGKEIHGWTSSTIKTARPNQTAEWWHQFNITCSDADGGYFTSSVINSVDWSGSRSFSPQIHCGSNHDLKGKRNLSVDDTRKRFCQNASYTYHYKYTWYDGDGNKHEEWRTISDTTNNACVYVPYHVPGCTGTDCSDDKECREGDGSSCHNTSLNQSGVVGSAQITSGSGIDISGLTVQYNDDIKFKYDFTNKYGPSKSPDVDYTYHIFTLESEYGDLVSSVGYKGYNHDPSPSERFSGHNDTYFINNESGSGKTGQLSPGGSSSRTHGERKVTNNLGQPGDLICTYVVMGPNASMVNDVASDTYVASPVRCVRITKKAQIQINGSDTYAGDGLVGDRFNDNDDHVRGSYTQYGQLTNNGKNNGFFGSAGQTRNYGNSYHKMVWANADDADSNAGTNFESGLLDSASYSVGDGGVMARLNKIRDATPETGLTEASGFKVEVKHGDLSLSGYSDYAGMIIVEGNAKITGNLGDKDNYNQAGAFTVYATGDIYINGSVSVIHANLVAGGRVYTCFEAGSSTSQSRGELGQNSGKCSGKLKVNGAVISSLSPVFRRTFGSGSCSFSWQQGRNCKSQWSGSSPQDNHWWTGSTSEWFNYTPDVWYLPNQISRTLGNLKGYQVVDVQSMPTRY